MATIRQATSALAPGVDPNADLQSGISSPRFQTFLVASRNDEKLARSLYVWNRDLSVAILADIAILEVALRNSMHEAATAKWGPHWYSDSSVALDERSVKQLSSAWGQLSDSVKKRARDNDLPGRVVAQCMFGFWTNLLDAGSHLGQPPRRVSVDYDLLWNAAFKKAFPGGRAEARAIRKALIAGLPADASHQTEVNRLQQEVAFTRGWVHGICKNVNDLRNRVAHHEPLINGFPLNGQNRRMSAEEGHQEMRILARLLDRKLASWLDGNSKVESLLTSRPQ